MLYGSENAVVILINARMKPQGSHISMAKVISGVGLSANLPSWNISGFGYLSLARIFQFFFSASATIYTS
ncbi:hypothetical protein GmHk_03G008661 [Glycine max]|nr:hypothetical protein GmHk_03G008661 [Glycine max]